MSVSTPRFRQLHTSSTAKGFPEALTPKLTLLFPSYSYVEQLQKTVKRIADVILASLGFMMMIPLLLVIATAIRLTSPGPIFYKSLRIGHHYKPFYMLKFRTMQMDADTHRDRLREEAQLHGHLFKLENDPRITPIGAFLRAFSLDELPQLLNVIKGEMSLVGPRPLPPDESTYFQVPYTLRYNVVPGITGAWQVGGRSQADFTTLCKLELEYVLNWSLFEDIIILLKTFPAVLTKKGAC